MAGHSKWANIKHRKGRQDALRGKANTKLIREITVATKESGPDASSNPRLRLAIEKANRANVTKDSIKKAIDKGAGNTTGEDYFEVVYEGYAPAGIAMMVACLTDNKNRTVSEVRHAFSKHGGNLGTDGSVSYLFDRKGTILIDTSSQHKDDVQEKCFDMDIGDIHDLDENQMMIITEPAAFSSIIDEIGVMQWPIINAELSWLAHQQTEISDEDADKIVKLEQVLEDLDDVQAVYHNASLSS